MPAVPGETLVDYFLRVLERVRQTGQPLTCEHHNRVFVAHDGMTTNDIVRAWHDGAQASGPQREARDS
jgi:hypothetical protein